MFFNPQKICILENLVWNLWSSLNFIEKQIWNRFATIFQIFPFQGFAIGNTSDVDKLIGLYDDDCDKDRLVSDTDMFLNFWRVGVTKQFGI